MHAVFLFVVLTTFSIFHAYHSTPLIENTTASQNLAPVHFFDAQESPFSTKRFFSLCNLPFLQSSGESPIFKLDCNYSSYLMLLRAIEQQKLGFDNYTLKRLFIEFTERIRRRLNDEEIADLIALHQSREYRYQCILFASYAVLAIAIVLVIAKYCKSYIKRGFGFVFRRKAV